MTFKALVLAGTRPGGDRLSGHEGKSHKALIELGEMTLLERVVAALRTAGADQVAVSCDEGPVASEARRLGADVIPPGMGPSESTAMAFDALGAPLVVTTTDHALLRPDWVSDLIARTPDDADLGVMMAERAQVEESLPGTRRTYLRFSDGEWSGCNLFYLRTPESRRAIETWRAVEADRKRPWRIARRLGLATLLDYVLGRLSLAAGIEKLGAKIGVEARLVRATSGLAAVDVDKPEDLVDVRRVLSGPAI